MERHFSATFDPNALKTKLSLPTTVETGNKQREIYLKANQRAFLEKPQEGMH